MALAAMGAGAFLVQKALGERLVREAVIDGLYLRLDYAQWLVDQMEHSQVYPMPPSMMPDMPEHGIERLSAELILYNRGDETLSFSAGELALEDEEGKRVGPAVNDLEKVHLGPGQIFNTVLYFDYDSRKEAEERSGVSDGDLSLAWKRSGRKAAFLIPHPPSHRHDEDEEGLESIEDWPLWITQIPTGDPADGEDLFVNKFGCVSCHGHPRIPGSAVVGPPLGSIAKIGANRVEGMGAPQYIYESILNPNAYIVPDCPGGKPCASPSAMPDYRLSLKLEDMASLVAYLMSLESGR